MASCQVCQPTIRPRTDTLPGSRGADVDENLVENHGESIHTQKNAVSETRGEYLLRFGSYSENTSRQPLTVKHIPQRRVAASPKSMTMVYDYNQSTRKKVQEYSYPLGAPNAACKRRRGIRRRGIHNLKCEWLSALDVTLAPMVMECSCWRLLATFGTPEARQGPRVFFLAFRLNSYVIVMGLARF